MKGIWIEPVPHLVLGQIKEWADNAKVSPVRIPGYLLDKPGSDIAPNAPASRGEQIILTCHGGAYIFGSANPDDPTANIGKGILEHVQSIRRILSVEYRLSAGPPFTPANPFPAALLDALAAYNHLVNVLGFEPQNIILEGDSAGANLVLTLTKYLVEYRDELTKTTLPGSIPLDIPGGLICCSPWADLGKSHHREPAPYLARSDYIGNSRGPRANYGASAFVGPLGLTIADTNEYISPASKFINKVSFAGWPRSLIIASDAEYLAPAIRTLKERMAEDMGEGASAGQVSYIEVPDGIHDFICFPWHEPERSQVLQGIADWVDQ
jgi:acetyl esterase/lipase